MLYRQIALLKDSIEAGILFGGNGHGGRVRACSFAAYQILIVLHHAPFLIRFLFPHPAVHSMLTLARPALIFLARKNLLSIWARVHGVAHSRPILHPRRGSSCLQRFHSFWLVICCTSVLLDGSIGSLVGVTPVVCRSVRS